VIKLQKKRKREDLWGAITIFSLKKIIFLQAKEEIFKKVYKNTKRKESNKAIEKQRKENYHEPRDGWGE
jgi:hypothetical protein